MKIFLYRIVCCLVFLYLTCPCQVVGYGILQFDQIGEECNVDTFSSTLLPIIHIDTDNQEIGRDKRTQATIRIECASSCTSFCHVASIKVRGASSASYPKKSYAIEFCDTIGNEEDISLFDMRCDGDWILDAMYIDHSRMRNRLCTDIWNAYNRIPHISDEPEALNGTRGLFVEVFLNGKYNGLYCFTERIDRKQLKLKKKKNESRGLSYKAITWDNLMGYCSYNPSASKATLIWNGFKAEYPNELEYIDWRYLQDFLEFISPQYTSDERFAVELESYVHIDNIVDYTLLVSAIYAIDNIAKNVYLNIYNVIDDRRIFFTPWDLDATFGRTYEGSAINAYAFSGSVPFGNVLIYRLWENDVCDFRSRMKERWLELRIGVLSVDSVAQRIRTYQKLFEESGAFVREQKLWPQKCGNLEEEASFMIDWYTHNVAIIDNYCCPIKLD